MLTNQLKLWINILSNLTIGLITVSTTLFFWNLTTEGFETPKLLFLILATLFLLFLGALNLLTEEKPSLPLTPLHLPLVMLLIVASLSFIFTPAKWVALYGNYPDLHTGLVAVVFYILFYLVAVSRLKSKRAVRNLLLLLTVQGIILSLLGLLSYFGFKLPFNPTYAQTFTPTGTLAATNSILIMLLPFVLLQIILSGELYQKLSLSKTVNKVIWAIVLSLFGLNIALTGNLSLYIPALVVSILAILSASQLDLKKNYLYILVPVVIISLVILGSMVKTPLIKNNPLYAKAQLLPKEDHLPLNTSWSVSVSAFRDAPFWGTGPASYLVDFSFYKPIDFNLTDVWNKRFDQAHDEYLQVLATYGGAGVVAMLLLTVIFLSLGLKVLVWPHPEHNTDQDQATGKGLAISGLGFLLLLALHPSSLPVMIIGFLILAAFMSFYKQVRFLNFQSLLGSNQDLAQVAESIPGILVMLTLVSSILVLYFGGKFLLADYQHKQAFNALAKNDGLTAYNSLRQAESYNNNIDAYHTDLAQTSFMIANAIAVSHAPSQASPSGSLTDNDKQNIQALLQQSITEGKFATVLNPNSPANWETLALIYRQIAGVAQNALAFSLDSFGHAIQKDPFNPILRVNAGSIYYAIKNYDLAIRLFTDAVILKNNYVNGYYDLAVAYKDKGDTASALSVAQKLVTLVSPQTPEYQAAINLLDELKNKNEASASANNNQSGLSNDKLPKVLELPKPDKIATPAAIKK